MGRTESRQRLSASGEPVPTMQLIKLAVVKTLLDKQKQRVQTKQIHKASLSQAVRHWQKNELAGTFGAFRRLLAASPTANMQSLATQAGASPAHRVVDEESPATEGSWELLDIWDDRAVADHLIQRPAGDMPNCAGSDPFRAACRT